MTTPQEIYTAYRIMPSLQLHQLRVAAVGKLVCDNFKQSINARDVILACLFHDMGNIIKSNFSAFPDFFEPEGIAYWQRVKDEFVAKYGTATHEANVAIAREIGLPEQVAALIDGVSYSKMPQIVASTSFEQKITEYADTRVGPRGVLSQKERMGEGKQRYDAKQTNAVRPYYMDAGFEDLLQDAQKLEQQIFAQATIKAEDINEATVAPLIEELREYRID